MEAGTGLIDDLATLSDLTEDSLQSELLLRYRREEIYTYVGDVLIAVNPFKQLPIYGINHARAYREVKIRAKAKPHIFAVADNTYQSLVRNKVSQCIVVSGESGAGKTESTKLIVRHIAYLCSSKAANQGKNLSEQLVEVNPLLEAFGNARTTINNNSSRFGKYIELLFTPDGSLSGGRVSIFLLEKSRVVKVGLNERNFHVFYYMLAGLSPEQKRSYFLDSSEPHRLLSIPCDNGPAFYDASDISHCTLMYANLLKIMGIVGFKTDDISTIFALLAAIVHACDIRFEYDDETDGVYVADEVPLKIVAQLLQIPAVELATVLISNVTEVRGEKITNFKTVHQANDGRDALAKALYARLFSWIVHRLNETIAPLEERVLPSFSTIGALDIAGFENFQYNSFEQLCINLANEQLQGFFNEHIFALELEDLKRENVQGTELKFTNNEDIIKLFVEKPLGLFSLLDEESKFPKATDNTLLEKFKKNLSSNARFKKTKGRDPVFIIAHYAGHVIYHAAGFLEKNRDTLSTNIVDCLMKSRSQVVYDLFSAQISDRGDLDIRQDEPKRFQRSVAAVNGSAAHHAYNKNMASLTRMAGKRLKEQMKAVSTPVGMDFLPKSTTAGSQFLSSLAALTKKLSAGEPHFVRCIKPNQDKRPDYFVSPLVLQQLRYTGVMETVRIRREGYPTRLLFRTFVDRYKFISFPLLKVVAPDACSCEVILIQAGLTLWAIGKTKVFLKYWHAEQLNAVLDRCIRQVVVVQRHVRGFVGRRRVQRLKQIVDARRAAMAKAFLQLVSAKCDETHTLLLASKASDTEAKRRREVAAAALLQQQQQAEERRRQAEEQERARRAMEEDERRRLQRQRTEEAERAERERQRAAAASEAERLQKRIAEAQLRARHEQEEELARQQQERQRREQERQRWEQARGAELARHEREAEADEEGSDDDGDVGRRHRARASGDGRSQAIAPTAVASGSGLAIAMSAHGLHRNVGARKEDGGGGAASAAFPRGSGGLSSSLAASAVGAAPSSHRGGGGGAREISASLADLNRPQHYDHDVQQPQQRSRRDVESWLAANTNHQTNVREIRSRLEAQAAAAAVVVKDHKREPLPTSAITPAAFVSPTAFDEFDPRPTGFYRGLSTSEVDLSRILAAAAERASDAQQQHLAKSTAAAAAAARSRVPQWRSQLAALTGMDTIREQGFDLGDASHYARAHTSSVLRPRHDIADGLVQEVECDVIRASLADKDCWCYLVYAEGPMHCAGRPCCYQEVLIDGAHVHGQAADAGYHVALGSVANPYRDPQVTKLREHVGKGLSLKVDSDGSMWVTRHSINEVVACSDDNPAENCFAPELVRQGGRLLLGQPVKVFDMSQFIYQAVKAIHEQGLRRLDRARLKRLCVVSLGLVAGAAHESGGQHLLALHVVNLVALRAARDEKILKELEKTMFKLAKMNVDLSKANYAPSEIKFKLSHRVPSKYCSPKASEAAIVPERLYDPSIPYEESSLLEDYPASGIIVQKESKANGNNSKLAKLGGRKL